MANYYSRSPPPLQHPVPTHPTYIPDPPSTPVSPQGYQRYTSSPPTAVPPQSVYAQAAYAPQFQPQGHASQPHFQPIPGPQGPGIPDIASAWGVNPATAQFGMQLGQSAVAAGQEYVQKNLGGLIPLSSLKNHFNVSNHYVMHKLRILLFPWRHGPWTRKVRRSEQGTTEWQSPRDDVNSPDLYIPLMAMVTYVLLSAFTAGLQSRFDPRILGVSTWKAILVVLLDFLFVKLGCYFLNIQGSSPVTDLIAYGGYKFVGVIVTLLAGLLGSGTWLYLLVFVYAFCSTALFMLRSLRSVVLPDIVNTPATVGTVTHSQRSRRVTFLFLVAMSQILYMGVLARV
ncbi:YIF1-domain-containing protein [Heliocybe sulcata]|uniref:Protein YIF1 n=1 Tax=Heliocybe sulcata TaxID=5364 RepID=A0A5C3MR46_9AGAM|nr:YIF1-domain-containing protein [Heliocybe sulcata]